MKNHFYSKANQMHQRIKFILFWNDTLLASDGLSVHSKIKINLMVHLVGFNVEIIISVQFKISESVDPLASRQQYLLTFACCCMYSLELLMMDGKTVRNM